MTFGLPSTKRPRGRTASHRRGGETRGQQPLEELIAYGERYRDKADQSWANALAKILTLDRYNTDAAVDLVELINQADHNLRVDAVRKTAWLLRRHRDDHVVVRTPAFESLGQELSRLLDPDDVSLFTAALPYLVDEHPAVTLGRSAELLHSADSAVRGGIGATLRACWNYTTERELLEMVLIDWLSREEDAKNLLLSGRLPFVPISRIPPIIKGGLAHASPLLRIRAAVRCAQELDAATAEVLVVEATKDEPDDVVNKYLDAAVEYAKARDSATASDGSPS
jgi:hypothetical protein